MASRKELFTKLGLMPPIIDQILDACYEKEEEQIFHQDLQSSPHGEHWSTSFHSSQFPGDDPRACPRHALYTMMNVPAVSPIDRALRQYGDLGHSIEESIVWRFYRAGILLTDPPSAEHQKILQDDTAWLTCAPDAIICLPKGNRPHPVEIKSRALWKIEEMKQGKRSYEYANYKQLQVQLNLTALAQEEGLLWDDLDPVQDGTIYYVARDNPSYTHEYRIQIDSDFYNQGAERLQEWASNFENDILPERPKEWKWTEEPCKYCPFKKEVCKPDYKANITELSKSHGPEWAEKVRGNYSYEEQKERVLNRWK